MKRVKWLDKECNSCGARLNSWDARISKTLAYKYPCCEKCIAKEYDKTPGELRERCVSANTYGTGAGESERVMRCEAAAELPGGSSGRGCERAVKVRVGK